MIFEADWQLLLKWHSLYGFLPWSKCACTLIPEQGGGCKGHSAIDQATQHIIEAELHHLTQKSAINLFLDTRHCFNLMVEACHNLACRHHGAADDYLPLHVQTHQLMKYYVRHQLGVSKDYNTFAQNPWHGLGQGVANAAICFIILLDTLIDAYHSMIQPRIIHDLTLTLTITNSIKAFIDNIKLSVAESIDSLLALYACASQQIQWWNQLLEATGGALNPSKCCCFTYSWTPDTHGILCLGPPTDADQVKLSLHETTHPLKCTLSKKAHAI